MSAHLTEERIHDWLDGPSDAADAERVRAHLAVCDQCRARVDAVAELLGALGDLPAEAQPARDLWGGIEARLGRAAPAHVIPFPTRAPVPTPRRISMTLPQTWAAGIVIALLSGAAVWAAQGGEPGRAARLGSPDEPIVLAADGAAGEELDQAVAELEDALRAGGDLMSPETRATIEESLAAIDDAIADARAALAADPASEVVGRRLLGYQKQKLRILRQATSRLMPTIS